MMSEPGKEPSANELLERIVRLEGEIARLEQRNAQAFCSLSEAISELSKGIVSEAEDNKHHLQHLNDDILLIFRLITDILDQLWPLVHEVFPGSIETQQQIANIIKNAGRSSDDKTPDH